MKAGVEWPGKLGKTEWADAHGNSASNVLYQGNPCRIIRVLHREGTTTTARTFDVRVTKLETRIHESFGIVQFGAAQIEKALPVYQYLDFVTLEDAGFCKKGQGGRFVEEHDLTWKGDFPCNTHGGQLSFGQPGLGGGGVQLVEAVRQMFGEATGRQVPDPANALVTGIGVVNYVRNWSVSAALVREKGA